MYFRAQDGKSIHQYLLQLSSLGHVRIDDLTAQGHITDIGLDSGFLPHEPLQPRFPQNFWYYPVSSETENPDYHHAPEGDMLLHPY
jgi:hypothetical protein